MTMERQPTATSHEGVQLYSWGGVMCSVCAPKDMLLEKVEAIVGRMFSTGTDNADWMKFKGPFVNPQTGKPSADNPHTCEANPHRQHWLLCCYENKGENADEQG